MPRTSTKTNDTTANLGFEAKLWAAADALRNNMDDAEYKHVVLGSSSSSTSPTRSRELVKTVGANVTIDWRLRENVRAQLRVLVKRILRKYGYPPDKQEKATETVLEQAALLSAEWATA